MATSDRSSLPPVIVLGGDDNGLSIARSLGRRGIPVHALGCASRLRHTRFARWIAAGNGASKADPQPAWLDWLTGEGSRAHRGSVILPCNDHALELLARSRAVLKASYILPDGNDEVGLAMLDKATTYDLASKIGVPAPRTWLVHRREDLVELLAKLPYPCALKPRHSHRFWQRFKVKLFVAHDASQLLARFDELEGLGLQMLVTEIIPGDDARYCSYWTYLDDAGRHLFDFTKRKPRQYPAHFGMGTFHITDWDPEVAELGLRFLRGVGLKGIGIVEFKRDPRDGKLKLIECNARFTKANQIVVRSGIDLPLLVYNHLTGRPLPPRDRYRRGVRLWFPLDDYRAFRDYRKNKELTLGAWIRSLCHGSVFVLLDWSDPWPDMVEVWDELLLQVGASIRRLREALAPRNAARGSLPRP